MRNNFSATASWIALLRFGKNFDLTSISKRLSVLSSIVIAIFDVAILITSGMTIYHTALVCKRVFLSAAAGPNRVEAKGRFLLGFAVQLPLQCPDVLRGC
jgi:hypothetical protein